MLNSDAATCHTFSFKISNKLLADRNDLVCFAQRESVELVVQKHLEIGPRIPMMEGDPVRRAIESAEPHQEMRFHAMRLNDVRFAYRADPSHFGNDIRIEREAFPNDMHFNTCFFAPLNK